MNKFRIKSFCKINLFLRVLGKSNSKYHKIQSLITFCNFYDILLIKKIKGNKDIITFTGKFQKGINTKSNTITKTLFLLRKRKIFIKQFFKIIIQKNIPHGSGLGGGSSNAASLLNFFNTKMCLDLKKKDLFSLAKKVGFDVPICLEKKNTFLTGEYNKILKISKKFKLSIIIVYPNLVCSTKEIYKKNKNFTYNNLNFSFKTKSKNELMNVLKNEKNDLQDVVVKNYPKIGNIINFIEKQNGCHFSRITGSGSACIGIFSNDRSAIYCKKMIRLKFPKLWCVTSKTI